MDKAADIAFLVAVLAIVAVGVFGPAELRGLPL